MIKDFLKETFFQEKLVWIFNAFDKDNGGTIDMEEIRCLINFQFFFLGNLVQYLLCTRQRDCFGAVQDG